RDQCNVRLCLVVGQHWRSCGGRDGRGGRPGKSLEPGVGLLQATITRNVVYRERLHEAGVIDGQEAPRAPGQARLAAQKIQLLEIFAADEYCQHVTRRATELARQS